MIAQPASPATPSALAALEQEVLLLRATLDDALCRIRNLEQHSQANPGTARVASSARELVAQDSPEMAFGLQLCQEMFPSCTVEVDIESDPSEPDWPWYTLTIQWQGEVRDSVDREMAWHEKMAERFPHILDQFRLFVDLQ